MPPSAFRFITPIVVVLHDADTQRLVEFPAGSVFVTVSSTPDFNGLIDGTCDGKLALMFARDLDERAERIVETEEVPA